MKLKVRPPSLFRFCAYDQCGKQLPSYMMHSDGRRRTFTGLYCDSNCYTHAKRGRSKFDKSKPSKNHIRLRVNGGREYLHRHLFEKHVRPLQDGEIVHHIDDDKFNNATENFEALPNRSEHMKTHYRHKSGAYSKLIEDCPF